MEKKAKQNAWSKTNKSVHFIYCCMREFSDDFRSNVKSSNCLRSIYISIKFPEENSFQSRFIVIKLNSIYYDDIRKWNSHSISFSRIRSVFMSFPPRFHCHFRNVMGNQQSIANHDIRHFIFNCPIHYHWLLNANNINWQIIIFFCAIKWAFRSLLLFVLLSLSTSIHLSVVHWCARCSASLHFARNSYRKEEEKKTIFRWKIQFFRGKKSHTQRNFNKHFFSIFLSLPSFHQIDQLSEVMTVSPNGFWHLSLPHSLYLGGSNNAQYLPLNLKELGSFVGCIQKVRFAKLIPCYWLAPFAPKSSIFSLCFDGLLPLRLFGFVCYEENAKHLVKYVASLEPVWGIERKFVL